MYANIVMADPQDDEYVSVRIHRQQLLDLNKALFALSNRKEDNPESERHAEPSFDTIDDLSVLISKAYQFRGK